MKKIVSIIIMWLVSLFLLHMLRDIGIKQYGIHIDFWYVGLCMGIGMMYQLFCNWLQD